MVQKWQNRKLGELAKIVTGKLDANRAVKDGAYPFYTCADEVLRINETTFDSESILVAGNGDFWVKYHPSGKFNAYQRTYVIQNFSKETTTRYLYFVISTQTPKFKKMAQGGIIKFLHLGQLQNLKIPLPFLQIQKQIVERMDKIAEAQKLNDELIQKADELYRSLLHNELNAKFKNQNAKSQFKIKKLGEVAEIIMGQSPPSSNYNERGEGLPFFQGKAEFGEIYPTPVKYCPKPTRIVEAGDILMSVRAPVGNINLAKEKSGIGRGLGAIRARKGVNQSFLYFFFIKNENSWSRLSVGSTFSAIRRNNLDNLEVPIPPLKIQKQIVAKLSAAQEYKKQLLAQKSKLKELFDSILHKSMREGVDN